jgi:hypothetical protein
MTTNCRGCGNPLTEANDSAAHIIPNALGGRLAPTGIICRTCNTVLDKLADNALVEAFGDWPTLLDIPRQRGKNPPRLIETLNGHRVRMNADGTSTRTDIQYDVDAIPEGHLVQIAAGDIKTFRQLLGRVTKQFPQVDAAVAERHARTVGIEDDDKLKIRLDFSPDAVFGGIVTAIWLFLVQRTGHAFLDWSGLQKCIVGMRARGGTFRYFVGGLPGLRGPEVGLGHKIIARSVPSTGELIAYVEILGILKVGGVFAKSPAPSMALEHIYALDLLSKTDRSDEYSIDAAEFERQDWSRIGLGPTDAAALRAHFAGALDLFINHYRNRLAVMPPSSN